MNDTCFEFGCNSIDYCNGECDSCSKKFNCFYCTNKDSCDRRRIVEEREEMNRLAELFYNSTRGVK